MFLVSNTNLINLCKNKRIKYNLIKNLCSYFREIMKKVYHLEKCSTCQRILKEVNWIYNKQEIRSEKITEDQIDYMASLSGSYQALFSKRAIKYRTLEGIFFVNLGRKYMIAIVNNTKPIMFVICSCSSHCPPDLNMFS